MQVEGEEDADPDELFVRAGEDVDLEKYGRDDGDYDKYDLDEVDEKSEYKDDQHHQGEKKHGAEVGLGDELHEVVFAADTDAEYQRKGGRSEQYHEDHTGQKHAFLCDFLEELEGEFALEQGEQDCAECAYGGGFRGRGNSTKYRA